MKKYSFLICMACVLMSCGDSFLTMYPTSSQGADEYYTTKEQIFKSLVGAYDPLQWTDFYGGYNQLQFMSDLRSDDIFVGGDIGSYNFFHQMEHFNMHAIDAPVSLWECLYIGVNRANTVIQYMPNIIDIEDAERNRYLAEAYFLRAWYYHWLWKFWGNIPYYEEVLTAPYMAKQLPADEVYAHIIADLDNACYLSESGEYHLPKTVNSAEYGRVTIYAAQMLRARVVMFQNDEARYETVYKDMKRMSMLPTFALKNEFGDMWKDEYEFITDPTYNKTESIWEINHISANGSWSWPQGGEGTVYPKFIGINGLEGDPEFQAGWGFAPVRKELFELYEEDDIRRDGGIIDVEQRITDMAAEGISLTYSERADHTGYFNKKYAPRKGYNDISYDVELNFNNNIRVFRFAETLLNYAELALILGKQGEAQQQLDKVRARAFAMTTEEYTASAHYRVVSIDYIMEERRLEFALEGMRFWDLLRTGNTAVLTETNNVFSRTWNDNYRYLPIPTTEIDRTEGEYKLKQNTGY